jgi:hypothetical protein
MADNFQEMTTDELKEFISNTQEAIESGDVEGTLQEVEENNEAPQEQEDATEQPGDVKDQEPDASQDESNGSQFDGKSAEELLQIIQNQQQFISKQGNQIGELRKQTKELKDSTRVKPDTSKYQKDDVDFIKSMIREEYNEYQNMSAKKLEEERQEALTNNQQAFMALQADKAIYDKLKPYLEQAYSKSGEEALYQPGWVQDQIGVAVKQLVLGESTKKQQATQQQASIEQRKKQASSVSSGGTSKVGDQAKKSVSNMSSEDYLKSIQSQLGLKDNRRRKYT